MSDTGKQSPLGVNTLSSLLQNQGFNINPIMVDFTGVSISETSATNLGSIVNDTCLRLLTYAFNDAYGRGQVNTVTYNNLISIGSTTIPALGNSKAPTFNWTGYPNWASDYTKSNEVTRWGYVRLFALQGYNEFNYNNGYATGGEYKDFLSAFMAASSFVEYTNKAILSMTNSQDFLDGTYSNMNDLISADIAGISLATSTFGRDLITSGKAINLAKISTFGLPSNLLETLQKYNAITKEVSLAILSSGLQLDELSQILTNFSAVTQEQERRLYAAYNLIVGDSLNDVLVPLNCKVRGLESLADLLNPQKLFPNSYQTLTVPVYNTTQGPTNSKTYYPIYVNGGLNSNLRSALVTNQIGTQTPTGTPVIAPSATQTANQVTVYQYTMTDEQGNPIDLVARVVDGAIVAGSIVSAGDSGGDGGSSGGGDGGGGGASGGGGGGAM
jgi:uncharacterized membrane protein YgcG